MNLQPIFDIPEICFQYEITHAVISPGSRNAALTIAFARHPKIKCLSVPDERAAGFIALGISLQTKVPTVLICTSGSAGLNYAPAVAEAYFNQIPLLILTADRPPELIGKRDGQTIYQKELFGKHAKGYFDFPSLDGLPDKTLHKFINDAIKLSISNAHGPVQINIPFEEPFYPKKGVDIKPSQEISVENLDTITSTASIESLDLHKYDKILFIAGQEYYLQEKSAYLEQVLSEAKTPLVADLISNCSHINNAITQHELFLKFEEGTSCKPDLIISFGLSVLSKSLKLFLKQHDNIEHWHVTPNDDSADTYGHLSKTIPTDIVSFLKKYLNVNKPPKETQEVFWDLWQSKNRTASKIIEQLDQSIFTEINIYKHLLHNLPNSIDLHLANSMAVRYANATGIQASDVRVYCNRGTSGIDGSNSTAVGSCLASDRDTILMTGDVAFFYDRNAFWHNHLPDNLYIILFNNNGGNIFRMIDGPSAQPELKEFFETDQKSTAVQLAQELDFEYYPCHSFGEVDIAWNKLKKGKGRKIIEVFTDPEENKTAYKLLFKKVKELNR